MTLAWAELFFSAVGEGCTSRPLRNVSTGYVSLRRKINFAKFPFVNGDVSEAVDLISMTPDHKLYVGEGIRSILGFIASIYFSTRSSLAGLWATGG